MQGEFVQDKIGYLVNIGLTENEAKVYFCLLKKNQFTASEISQCANVNRSKIYSVLNSLTKKGFCTEQLGKVRKFEGIDPKIALEKLKEEQKQKIHNLDDLTEILSPIFQNQTNNSSPLDFIQVFSTPAGIIKKHHTLELQSKECVLSFCKPPFAMTKETGIHEEQAESMTTGVVYKSIFEVEEDDLQFFAKRMKSFEEQGEEIRVAYHLPIKLHVFDNTSVMFSMINQLNPEENLTYLVIEHPDLAETLISTFYKFWEKAISVDDFIKKENIKIV
jgi:HTH-type transcriptional regulator, sugar sensing transcriptional regulator